MSDLLSLQRLFHRALNGATDALAEHAPDTARRILVHRATVSAGLGQVLENIFPAVRRVVGAPAFANLAARFIAAAPPRDQLLSGYGRGFATFIAGQPLGASLAYLHDLAQLEWMRHEAYLAADAPVLDARRLDTGNAEALSALTLRLHPAARVIASPFPVHRIWRLNQPDVEDNEIPPVDLAVAEAVVVTRPGSEVVTRATSLADASLVRALGGGATLSAAVNAALAVAENFDVTAALAGHFANGTFAAPDVATP